MYNVYKDSHIVILPSYREGMPKTLLEGCAMGRAIITTNSIGCKECVDEGINGLKVPVKDSQSLANAIETLVNNPSRIIEMGKASRLKAKKEFDINFMSEIKKYNKFGILPFLMVIKKDKTIIFYDSYFNHNTILYL